MQLAPDPFSRGSYRKAFLSALILLNCALPHSSLGSETAPAHKTLYAPTLNQQDTLIAVDGIYVRGKTSAQINKLLSGDASTNVECTFLDQNEIKKVSLPRTKMVQANGNPFENSIIGMPISPKLDAYPGTYRVNTNFDTLDNFTNSSPEIASEAAEKTKLEQIRTLPFADKWILNVNLVRATTAYDRMGDWKAAEKCIELLESSGYFSTREVTGMQYQNDKDSQIAVLIQDLLQTGRYDLLCKIFTQMQKDSAENKQPFPNQYFDALTRRGNLSKEERADLLKFAKTILPWEGLTKQTDICDDLERVGEFATAAELYTKMLEQTKTYLADADGYKSGNSNISEVSRFAYELANAQQKSGDIKAAIKTTEEMLSKYDPLIPPKLQMLEEKLDKRFPRRSDLELQLATFYFENNELDKAEKYATFAIGRITEAVGDHNSSLKRPYEFLQKVAIQEKDKVLASQCADRIKQLDPIAAEHLSDSQTEYALVQAATTSIEQHKLHQAEKAIQELLRIYQHNEQNRIADSEPLNLLSALTIQARSLADHGYLNESDDLLNELNTTSKRQNYPNSMCMELDLELLLNKDAREKQKGHAVVETWSHTFPATALLEHDLIPKYSVLRDDVMLPMQQQEILREQALAYEFAGDLNRATAIVNHALAYRKLKVAENDDTNKLSNEVVSVLLLDKARLLAKENSFDKAQSVANDALQIYGTVSAKTYLISNKMPYDAQRIATYEKLIRNKTVALARVLIDSDKLKAAGQLLELLQAQIEQTQRESNWVFQGPDFENAGYEWMVAANIADIYFRQKDMTKANMWLDKALSLAVKRPSQGLMTLAATIAIAEGDHKKAAAFYKRGATECADIGVVNGWYDEGRRAFLAASKSEASLSGTSEKDDAIDASIAAAKELEKSQKIADSLAAYQKIYPTLAQTDKRRLDVRQAIMSLQRNLAWKEKSKKILAEVKTGAQVHNPTPAEEEKARIENALAEIPDEKELAQIAEETHHPLEWDYWFCLANLEVTIKDPKDAAIHAYKFLKTCPPEKMKSIFPICDPLAIAIEVSNQQNNNDGEGILRAYIASFGDAQSGSKTTNLTLQSHVLAYYVATGQFNKAKEFMPKLLQGSGLAMEDDGRSGNVFRLTNSYDSAKLSHEQNITLAKEFLELEKKELPADDRLIASILDALATNEARWGMTREAIRDYLESERIDEKYVGYESAKDYEYRLKPLLLKTGDKITLEIIESKCKKFPDDVNPQYPYEHIEKSIDKDAPLAKKLEQAEVEYSLARTQAMYSIRSEYALNNVILYTEEANEWQKAVNAHLQLCELFEHSNQTNAGFHDAHFTFWDKRVKYYLPAIDACLKAKNNSQAIQIIHRALNILPDVSTFEFAELGRAAVKCGDTKLAEQLAYQSEALFKDEYSWNPIYEQLTALWKELGNVQKAASLKQIQMTKREQEEHSQLRKDLQSPHH